MREGCAGTVYPGWQRLALSCARVKFPRAFSHAASCEGRAGEPAANVLE